MKTYHYVTVDVFTDKRFTGNPLAVFPAAEGLSDAQMRSLAAEMNYSETTFVLPPTDAANTARVRIFHRTGEMPFAGHPNVGTGYVLSRLGLAAGDTFRFENRSGVVAVRLQGTTEGVVGAEIDAPQILSILGEMAPAEIAACLSLEESALDAAAHAPVRASVGVEFVLVKTTPDGLTRAAPDISAYRRLTDRHPELRGRLSIFAYADTGGDIRARMFAPLSGTWEDPATGSANATLAAFRLSQAQGEALGYIALQGVEMGRQSRLKVRAWRTPQGIRASVGGNCVEVFRGAIAL